MMTQPPECGQDEDVESDETGNGDRRMQDGSPVLSGEDQAAFVGGLVAGCLVSAAVFAGDCFSGTTLIRSVRVTV
jgi:hypothetical protein